MTTVASTLDQPSFTTVVKHEYGSDMGYCRKLISVTKVAGMRIGTVLGSDGVALTDAEANSLPTEELSIIVDEKIYRMATSDVANVAVIYRGPVAVSQGALHTVAAFDTASRDFMRAKLVAQGFQLLPTVTN